MPRSNAKKSTRETKRTQKAELRRDEIMSAAIDVFHRDGFRGASLEDVADEVGISKSLIYYHFKNKMELLAEMNGRMGVIFFDEILPILQDESIGHEERLRRSVDVHVRVAIANQRLFEIYFRERHEVSEQTKSRLYGSGESSYVSSLSKLLKDGTDAGVFATADATVAAFTIVGACNWITFWYRSKLPGGRKALGATDIAAIVFDTVGKGLVTR